MDQCYDTMNSLSFSFLCFSSEHTTHSIFASLLTLPLQAYPLTHPPFFVFRFVCRGMLLLQHGNSLLPTPPYPSIPRQLIACDTCRRALSDGWCSVCDPAPRHHPPPSPAKSYSSPALARLEEEGARWTCVACGWNPMRGVQIGADGGMGQWVSLQG